MNNKISRVGDQSLITKLGKGGVKDLESRESFEKTLSKFITDVNSLQNQAAESTVDLVNGEVEDVHDVMIAVKKASIAMELMLEIRNKIVEAYQEVMRMPV